ncbi:hypothetical protein PV11_05652 [Exophiala sideris]|uniref:RGS domain-containing protein n=1 Tax=Exophiala sideris TaxID=1016849 RepID=A0A0D1ZA45_9EURO|nr:hypothetical protein PV11_05652 [Exophiala sideris]
MSPSLLSWLHWYRKPSYLDPVIFSKSANADIEQGLGSGSGSRPSSVSSQSDTAIPADLSLDRVLANKTCSPLSLYDFYMYLKHIEMSPENLEFYIWFKDYEARYQQQSHPGLPSQMTPLLVAPTGEKSATYSYAGAMTESELDDEKPGSGSESELQQYIESLVAATQETRPCRNSTSLFWPRPSPASDRTLTARPFSNHAELSHVSALFLTPSSRKELNIPPSMREKALDAIATSDSPEHLAPVANHVYYLLRNCSHRNFIRLGVKNGTFETLCMVTIVGCLFTALGLLTMLLVAFASPSIHHSSRWRGLASVPFWMIGFSFLFAGWRGSCFLLLLFSRRQELPWERLEDNASTKSGRSARLQQLWLVRFAKKLMIFERKIRVKDQGLRHLQRKIVVQSVVAAVIVTAVLEVVWLVLPIWK